MMNLIVLSTEDETWTLQGDAEDLVLTYRHDDVPGVMSLPVTDDVLLMLAARRARQEALH